MIFKAFISFIVSLIFLCISNESICQTISNVNSKQSGNTIEITYTLSSTTACEIALYVSLDGGTTWKGPLTKVQGAVGKDITSGEHTIIWNVIDELEELTGDNILFKVATIGKKPFEPEMVLVEGDAFLMGSTAAQSTYDAWGKNKRIEETPQHLVKVSSFYLSKFEVTQAQWQAVMGTNPSLFKNCPQCPVENVSYDEVIKFITKLNSLTGKNYRLPTESEWEFAYRGGIQMSKAHYNYPKDSILMMKDSVDMYSISISELQDFKTDFNTALEIPCEYNGWLSWNSGSKTHKVGLKSANYLGLYDMGGNVAEWCSDWYGAYEQGILIEPKGPETGEKRTVRGGGYSDNALACRYASRKGAVPTTKSNKIGFRLALSLTSEPTHISSSQSAAFAINPLWSFLRVCDFTNLGERMFLTNYSNPDSCQKIWKSLIEKEYTDLDQNEFCQSFLVGNNSITANQRVLARDYFFDGYTKLKLASFSSEINFMDARNSFNKGIELDSTCAQLFYGRGMSASFGQGDYNQQMADYEKASELNKNYTAPLMILAKSKDNHSIIGQKEAYELFSRIITLQPNNTEAYEYRAMVTGFYSDDYKSAISDLTKCIEYSDNKKYYLHKRSICKAKAHDYRGAIEDLTYAIAYDESDCLLYRNRAGYRYENYDYKGAIADYTTTINCYSRANAGSDCSDDYLGRGKAKFSLKDYSGAAQDFTKAIELNKGKYGIASMYSWRGDSYFEGGKYSLAIADYDKIIALQPDWVIDAYYQRGLAKLKNGAKETGCQDLRKAADLGNEDAIDAVRQNCQ